MQQENYAMMAADAEMLSAVASLMRAGRRCGLGEGQESAITVASMLLVTRDLRDMMEVCAAQLVRQLVHGISCGFFCLCVYTPKYCCGGTAGGAAYAL